MFLSIDLRMKYNGSTKIHVYMLKYIIVAMYLFTHIYI